jgi:hypothetical protein
LNRIGQAKSIKLYVLSGSRSASRLLNVLSKKLADSKFARRFVISIVVIIRTADPYVEGKARTCGTVFASQQSAGNNGRPAMKKTILIIVGSALLAASTVQIAAAAEHHKARRAERAPAPVSEPFRNPYGRNAYDAYGWASPAWVEPGWSRYQNGAMSAPAGR